VSAPSPLQRPATLTFAFFGGILAGLFSIVGAVLLIMQAKDLAKDVATDFTSDADILGSSVVQAAIDEAASKLVIRGVMVLVSGVLILAFALAVRNGATWARIVLTVLLVGALCTNGLVISDVAPAATTALGVATLLLSVAVVVLMFLPPTNRYAKARKR
jgi:hypothetical protein